MKTVLEKAFGDLGVKFTEETPGSVIAEINKEIIGGAVLLKGEASDLMYESGIKFAKSGKEIKDKLKPIKAEEEGKKNDAMNGMEALKKTLKVKPFKKISHWRNGDYYELGYPWEMTRYEDDNMSTLKSPHKMERLNVVNEYTVGMVAGTGYESGNEKQYSYYDSSDDSTKYFPASYLPASEEEAGKYSAYNAFVNKYLRCIIELRQVDILERNLSDKKKYDLSSKSLVSLGF